MQETAVRKRTSKKKESAEDLSALSMDEAYSRLDALITEMEEGEHTLEESFDLYSKGMALVKVCSDKIDKVEKELVILEGGTDESEDILPMEGV